MLRDDLKSRTGISFEDFFRGDPENTEDNEIESAPREYLMFFASESLAGNMDASELTLLEAQPEIDAIMPLPPRWKLSPLLMADDGHDDDTSPDALKTLKVRVADRAKIFGADEIERQEIVKGVGKHRPSRHTMGQLSGILLDILQEYRPSSSLPDTSLSFKVESAGAESASLFGEDVAAAERAAESSDWLIVENVPALQLSDIALHIATEFSPCLRIEPKMLHLPSNAWARWVTQSYANAAQNPTLDVTPAGTRTTVWDRGIRGENQIVGVGDSGLATKNCQFNDPNRPVPTIPRGTTHNDASHRKVIQYVAFADGGAGENEDHGTHVSGSVAGKTPQGGALGAYDGMAPEVSFAGDSISILFTPLLSVPVSSSPCS